MSTPRKILHLDLDAFFCAVEELSNPALVGKPFAVGGRPEERGVVASCSYPARRFGVRSAMPMSRALKLCPGLIIISHRHGAYSAISKQVMARLEALSPLIEQVSIDEAFLDVSDLAEPVEAIARRLQAQIRAELQLPCSIGTASNKLVAKIANDVGKAAARGGGPPNAITVVPPGQEAAFLAPLPVESLWGVGPKTAERLTEMGIRTIGQLAAQPPETLERHFGKNGLEMAEHARGLDTRPIVTSHATKSISQETTFAQDVRAASLLRRTLLEQSEEVGRKLREERLVCHTIKIKLRWPDFTTLTRQVTLEEPTDQDRIIYKSALTLFEKHRPGGKAVRLIGVGVAGLGPPVRQLSLWDALPADNPAPTWEKERRLQTAIDELRQRFGKTILTRGAPHEEE